MSLPSFALSFGVSLLFAAFVFATAILVTSGLHHERIMFFLFVVGFGCARHRSSSGITRFRSFHSSNEAARPSPVTIWPAKYGSQTSSSRIAAAPVDDVGGDAQAAGCASAGDSMFPLQSIPRGIQPRCSRNTRRSSGPMRIAGVPDRRETSSLRSFNQGFKLALEDTGGTRTEPITHSTRFALVIGRE